MSSNSSHSVIEYGGGEDEDDADAEEEKFAPDSTDKKKQTHLRCERQRREAINSGYAELKQLLPSHMAPLGCKTTNASILYRACDYIRQLQGELNKSNEEVSKQKQQLMALQIICAQYEQLAMEQEDGGIGSNGGSNLKIQMFVNLMEEWFRSFDGQVSTESYPALTKSFLSWLERLDFENAPEILSRFENTGNQRL